MSRVWSACLALSLRRYQFILLGKQRYTYVNNLHRVVREAERPGLKPAPSRLQVRRPNHYATSPHCMAFEQRLYIQAKLGSGLTSCLLDSPSPFVQVQSILSAQSKSCHILSNTAPPCRSFLMSSLRSSIYLRRSLRHFVLFHTSRLFQSTLTSSNSH